MGGGEGMLVRGEVIMVMITSAETIWVNFTISMAILWPLPAGYYRYAYYLCIIPGGYPSSKMCTTFTIV